MLAAVPLIAAVNVLLVVLGGLDGAPTPSKIAGNTVPRPDIYTATVSPAWAGLSGVTREPSTCRAAASPEPLSSWVNTPGVLRFTNSVITFDACLLLMTWN